jgi:hypothetical protein
MAQQTIVTLVDDIDGSEATENVEYGLDGRTYEIDLNPDHAKALRESLADFIPYSRRTDNQRPAKPAAQAKPGKRTTADREQLQAIRDWARQNGHEVSERGRISKSVREAFDAAH